MTRPRPLIGPLALVAAGATAGVLLWRLGSTLPLPNGLSGESLTQWASHEGAATVTFAIARIAGLALAVYTTAVGMLGVLAGVSRVASLSRLAFRVTAPALRPLVAPVVVATLTLAVAVPAGAQGRGEPSPRPPSMRVVSLPSPSPEPPVMRVVATAPAMAPRGEIPTHTVVPGDTFWSIAEGALRASGSLTSDAAIIPYWHALIEANRDRLKAPNEPDLIYPGQIFVLPPVS